MTELRIVSTLLWDYIKQKLPPAEHDIVRNAGEAARLFDGDGSALVAEPTHLGGLARPTASPPLADSLSRNKSHE